MKNLKLILSLLVLINIADLTAQVSITTDGSIADPSAMLDVKSINKGMLTPRMTQTQIADILNPSDGLLVFNTDDNKFYFYNGTASEWQEIALGAGTITPSPPPAETSCLAILTASPGSPDGVYWIDPDGVGGNPQYQCYCDMTTDGGGWTLVLNLDTQDGNVQWYGADYWTSNSIDVGSLANRFTDDYKDAQSFSGITASDILVKVHEEGSVIASRSWNLASNNTLSYFFNGPINQTITSSEIGNSGIGSLYANEAVIQESGNLIVNHDYYRADKDRLANSTSGLHDNLGGGLGTHYDYDYPLYSRPCADATLLGTSMHWNGCLIGSDIMPGYGWGTPPSPPINYDYSIFVR